MPRILIDPIKPYTQLSRRSFKVGTARVARAAVLRLQMAYRKKKKFKRKSKISVKKNRCRKRTDRNLSIESFLKFFFVSSRPATEEKQRRRSTRCFRDFSVTRRPNNRSSVRETAKPIVDLCLASAPCDLQCRPVQFCMHPSVNGGIESELDTSRSPSDIDHLTRFFSFFVFSCGEKKKFAARLRNFLPVRIRSRHVHEQCYKAVSPDSEVKNVDVGWNKRN